MNRKNFKIAFISIIVLLVCMFCYMCYTLFVDHITNSNLSFDVEDSSSKEEDLYEPLDEDKLNKNNENTADFPSNLGAKYNEKTGAGDEVVTIINLNVLEKYIPTDGYELAEVNSYIRNFVLEKNNQSTNVYIEEATIKVNNDIISFELYNVSNSKLIGTPSINIKKETSLSNSFDIDNLNVLLRRFKANGDNDQQILSYVYNAIESGVKSVNSKVENCFIDTESIQLDGDIISFTVKDSKTKKTIKSFKLNSKF